MICTPVLVGRVRLAAVPNVRREEGYITGAQQRRDSVCAGLHVEYAERRIEYGIQFMFSPFYEYTACARA